MARPQLKKVIHHNIRSQAKVITTNIADYAPNNADKTDDRGTMQGVLDKREDAEERAQRIKLLRDEEIKRRIALLLRHRLKQNMLKKQR